MAAGRGCGEDTRRRDGRVRLQGRDNRGRETGIEIRCRTPTSGFFGTPLGTSFFALRRRRMIK